MKLMMSVVFPLLVLGDLRAAAQSCGAITETSHTYNFEMASRAVDHQLSTNERVVFTVPATVALPAYSQRGVLVAKFNVPQGNQYKALCTHGRHPDLDMYFTSRGQYPQRLDNMPTNFHLEGGSGNYEMKIDFNLGYQREDFRVTCEVEVRSNRCGDSDPARPTPSPNTGRTCNCGAVNRRHRIIGGGHADVGEYPWMVHLKAVYRRGHSGAVGSCGGVIITDRYILTAAHCVPDQSFDEHGRFLGHLQHVDILVDSVDVDAPHSIRATEVYSHENFINEEGRTPKNDIALLKVPRLDFAALNIGPVCMPPPDVDFQGMDSWSIGWGKINSHGDSGKHLKEIQMRVATEGHCRGNWASYDPIHEICNEAKYEQGTCQGDSGGPLTVNMDNHFYEIGIVSYGEGKEMTCNKGKVGIYTRVTGFLDWIRNTIQRNYDEVPCSM